MAQKTLVMGESGTGKSTSMRNLDPAITSIVNPVGKPLPFKSKNGKFTMLNNETKSSNIVSWMKGQVKAGKKILVVDDFQYLLSIPYMPSMSTRWNGVNPSQVKVNATFLSLVHITLMSDTGFTPFASLKSWPWSVAWSVCPPHKDLTPLGLLYSHSVHIHRRLFRRSPWRGSLLSQ